MAKAFKILILISLIVAVLFCGVTLTNSHNNKLFTLKNSKSIEILDISFLYSSPDRQDAIENNYTVNYYSLSFKANENIKNMSIIAIALDQNNRQLTLPDSIIIPKTQPFNYIIHSNATLSKNEKRSVELVFASKTNKDLTTQNLKSLKILVYDESNRLNELVSEYIVPVTIKTSNSSNYKSKYSK
ncbi:MAG: hypothetical protein LBR15_09220 [Methanobrevibacter sp.]|jgi:hypothetical protein|nr:hypothetical protein [Candidatus Methanovirga australis]